MEAQKKEKSNKKVKIVQKRRKIWFLNLKKKIKLNYYK